MKTRTQTHLFHANQLFIFFVCDHGNAKVKAFADQFISILIENGIKVYPEYYLTHQPGYHVRAASFNTSADFFFQIHSKTAGPGRVRLYLEGQPQRMTIQEALTYIWSMWRLKCGCLTKDEVESLSSKRALFLLQQFADIKPEDVQIETIQRDLKLAIERCSSVTHIIDRLNTVSEILLHAKGKISEYRQINTNWKQEPGTVLSRCPTAPIICGLSPPLKEVLLTIVEQTLNKVKILTSIAQNHNIVDLESETAEEELSEVEISEDQSQSISSWGLMIESVGDHQTSLSSFGDQIGSQGFMALAPNFLLDDF